MRLTMGSAGMSNLPNYSADEIKGIIAQRDRLQSAELALTRERAANWSKGIGALLVAALAFSLIKGRDDLTGLDPKWAIGVGGCLATATVIAAFAAYKLFRASYGPLKPLKSEVTDHQEATSTMHALMCGLVATAFAFIALLAAVALTWYGPDAEGPKMAVTDDGGIVWCGEPTKTGSGDLTLQVKGQQMKFDLDTISRLDVADSCPQ
ncbi:hypothetical protein [Rhodococcoides fascians]|uniref:hypothetical protein n=2 Tax=Nocardiaceae TaxID=85025 RepID=UPI00159562FA|nr:hypothetical protein [Rhodococcus fascians]